MSKYICQTCGKSFIPSRSDQMYCSARCRYRYNHNNDLILTVKKKQFELISSGIQTEVYLEIKPYWTKRFENYFGTHWDFSDEVSKNVWNMQKKTVLLRNGYKNIDSELTVECTLSENYGRQEWGAESGKKYYVLKIQRML